MKRERETGILAAQRFYAEVGPYLSALAPEECAAWWIGFLGEIAASCQQSTGNGSVPDDAVLRLAWGVLTRLGKREAADALDAVLRKKRE